MANSMKKKNITVIMLNFNSAPIMDIIEKSVDSILNQSFPISELIIADDNSNDSSLSELRKIANKDSRIHILTSAVQRGVAGARNFALRAAKGDIIAFIDNDAIPENNWIEAMLEKVLSDRKIGACVPMVKFLKKPEIICSMGSTITLSGYGQNIGIYQREEFFDCPNEVLYPTGNGLMVRRDVVNEIGGFDDRFLGWGGDDVDLGIRLRNADYKVITAPDAIIYHLHSYTNEVMDLNFWNARNTMRFLLKYYSWKDLKRWYYRQCKNVLRGHGGGVIPHAWLHNLPGLISLARFRGQNDNGEGFLDRYYPLTFEGCGYFSYPNNHNFISDFKGINTSIIVGGNDENYLYDGWCHRVGSFRGYYRWATDVAGIRFSLNDLKKEIIFNIITHPKINSQEISVIFRNDGKDDTASINITGAPARTEKRFAIKRNFKPGRYEVIFASKRFHIDNSFLPKKIGFGLKSVEVY